MAINITKIIDVIKIFFFFIRISYIVISVNHTNTFLIIPGNPPASFYYDLWCKELKGIYPEYHFVSYAYPIQRSQNSKDYISEIVDFYAQLILDRHADTPITIVGHSVGGHIAYELLKRDELSIRRSILIFPFFGKPRFVGKALLHVVSFIDRKKMIKKQLIKNKLLLSKIWKELENIKDDELISSTRLAHHEKYFFKDFIFPKINSDQKDKVHLIYNLKDTWCTPKAINKLKNVMDSTHIDSVHDFIVFPKERMALSKLMKSFL